MLFPLRELTARKRSERVGQGIPNWICTLRGERVRMSLIKRNIYLRSSMKVPLT